jgi:hypothetical protein
MQRRCFIKRMMLCLAVVLFACHVPAMAFAHEAESAKATLSHHVHPDGDSLYHADRNAASHHDDGACRSGCCASAICCFAIVADDGLPFQPHSKASHAICLGRALENVAQRPVPPPPKTV